MTRFPQGAAAAIVPQTAARWIAEGITKVGLQVAATGTGVKGSAATADPSQRSTNLVLAPDRHHGGHQRISVNVNGRLPFKLCHSVTRSVGTQPNSNIYRSHYGFPAG